MLADYHVHSEFSDDSVYPMEQIVQDAIRLGLDEICFTDHVDYGVKSDPGEPAGLPCPAAQNVDYPRYFERIRQMQRLYGGQIRIRAGLEFGVQVHTIPQFRALYRRWPLDFVLLSIHQVENREFWNQDFQTGRSRQEYNERYYQELLAVVQSYKEYSVLAHMDLIARYDPEGPYPFSKLRPLIEPILKQVIADRKGIELNTSSRRYGLADTTPSVEILKLYREMGGTILTLGSDSHRPGELGDALTQARQLLRELGFRQFCTFEGMQPLFQEL